MTVAPKERAGRLGPLLVLASFHSDLMIVPQRVGLAVPLIRSLEEPLYKVLTIHWFTIGGCAIARDAPLRHSSWRTLPSFLHRLSGF